MATVQEIYDIMPEGSILTSDTDRKKAANYAIMMAPRRGYLLSERIDNAGTFTAGTFVYAMSASLDREIGVGTVLINEATNHLEVRHRGLSQYFDQSAGVWQLEFPEDVVNCYIGKTFDILYAYRHPFITAMTSEVYLPPDYVMFCMGQWVEINRMVEKNTDQGHDANLFVNNQRMADRYWKPLPDHVPYSRRYDRPG